MLDLDGGHFLGGRQRLEPKFHARLTAILDAARIGLEKQRMRENTVALNSCLACATRPGKR